MAVGLKKCMTLVVLIVMIAGMMGNAGQADAYAEGEAVIDGGTILSDGTNTAEVFGTHAAYSADTNTITLNDDIQLQSPVVFERRNVTGYDGRTITLDLNGHSITGGPGAVGGFREDAEGKNAIEVIAADFSLVIKGPGRVTGGKGTVYESEAHVKSGCRGGMAVCLPGSEYKEVWYPSLNGSDRLEHGLTVTDGAVLTGGAGGDVSGNDLMYNIKNYSGYRGAGGSPGLSAGDGGAGIGQAYSPTRLAFARIVIENGSVTGGAGGNIDASMLTLTQYGIMNHQAVKDYMKGKSLDNYDWDINYMLKLTVGNGGDGISVGAGRKYIRIDKDVYITGGMCGSVDHGNSSLVNQIDKSYIPEAGDGISVNAGDIGLTTKTAGYSGDEWKDKGPDSEDMGIYVAGTVSGGDTPDTDAMNDSALRGGNGIFLNGDEGRHGIDINCYPYPEDPREWGIVDIEGTVTGGNGGSAVCGNAGDSGSGICEDFNQDYGYYGTNYYIVNGEVNGGKGGSSMRGEQYGYGNNGINILYNYRENLNIAGNGTVSGGDAGSFIDRDGTGSPDVRAEAVRLYLDSDTNRVDVKQVSGAAPKAVKKSKLNVTAGMTGFSGHPTTSTRLSCSFDKPEGYNGKVYIYWYIIMHGALYDDELFAIESPTLDLTDFHMLSNSSYGFLAYKKSSDYFYRYNANVMTTDRIKENNENNHTSSEIYCRIMLEDGRWGESSKMKFDKSGWEGSSTGTKPNPLKVKGKTASIRYSRVRKASQKLGVSKVIRFVNKGKGDLTYKKVSGNKKITINKKTGKVTIKKGLRKGTYKVTVKVAASGNSTYKPSTAKKVTFKIKIK